MALKQQKLYKICLEKIYYDATIIKKQKYSTENRFYL